MNAGADITDSGSSCWVFFFLEEGGGGFQGTSDLSKHSLIKRRDVLRWKFRRNGEAQTIFTEIKDSKRSKTVSASEFFSIPLFTLISSAAGGRAHVVTIFEILPNN